MAQVDSPKTFDKARIGSDVLPKIEDLVDFINQLSEQMGRALQNQLTFAENFRAKVITVSAYQNRELSLNERATAILPMSVLGDSITNYSATVSNAGVQKITFKFGNALSIRTRSVTYSAPFATYECETLTSLQVGDKVSITAQTNANNNGTFIISQVNATSIAVYNSNAVAATLTDYVGAYESAKQVTLLLLT